MRERLGEWVAGALEGEDAAAVERHVGGCEGCARELAAMTALEEDLRMLGPSTAATPRRRAPVRWLAIAAVAALAAVGVLAATVVRSDGVHGLYAGAVVEPEAGARLARLDERGARLERGAAEVHVQPGSGAAAGAFRIETPLGTFTVKGTQFRISVEEEVSVNNVGKVATIAVIAVVSGTVGYLSNDGRTRGEVDAGHRGVARQGSFEVAAAEVPVPTASEELAQIKKELEAVREERKSLSDSVEKSKADARAIEAKLAAVEKARDEAIAKAAPPAPAAKRIPISFGPHAALPEVADANWSEMGEAVKQINGLLGDLFDREKSGQASTEVQVALAQENMKLQKFAFAAIGKLPTHASGNGEFTHPIALANLISEHLKAAGVPFTERQAADLTAFGEEYDLEWERLQSGYGPDAYKLEKILDELEAKHRFFDRALGIMTPEQRAVIAPPEYHDLMMIDVHSPILMLATVARPYAIESAADLRAKLITGLAKQYELGEDEHVLLAPLADRMVVEVMPRLKPMDSKDEVQLYPYAEAIVAGRAVLKLRKDLPAALALDDEARARLRDDGGFGLPRLEPAKK